MRGRHAPARREAAARAGGTRRRFRRRPTAAGNWRMSRISHQGAHPSPSSVSARARFSATSHCTIKAARSSAARGSSSSSRKSRVVSWNGTLETARNGTRGSGCANASPSTTSTDDSGPKRSRSRTASKGSISCAITYPARRPSTFVIAPSPAPISSTRSRREIPASVVSSSATLLSRRKCCERAVARAGRARRTATENHHRHTAAAYPFSSGAMVRP